jgi:thiol:disulfide interchange protein DsbD
MQLNIKRYFFCLLLFCASLFPLGNTASAATLTPLPADEAFPLSVSFMNADTVMVKWRIASGYYLYTKRLKITLSPSDAVAEIHYPRGEWKLNEEQGRDEVYAGTLSIPLRLLENHRLSAINIDYQGCSQEGFCYPPMTKHFMLNIADLSVKEITDKPSMVANKPSFTSLLTDQNGVGMLLQDHPFNIMLLIFSGLGLLLAFTPCVLPMIPILTSIIIGQKHALGTKNAFFLSLTYVFGMSIAYACAGLIAASLGSSIQVWLQKPVIIIIVSALFMLLALSLFGLYELRFSRRWHNWISSWSNKHKGGTYIGVFFMGVLATLVVSPCVTAPLVGVLIYIGQTGNLVFGASALFAMGLGMGLPLLLIGMSAGRWLPKSGPWMKAVQELFGIFMMAMAIWLLSRIVSLAMTQILFGLLLLGLAGFMGIYLPRLIKLRQFNRLMGLSSALLGLFLVFNGLNVFMTAGSLPAHISSPSTFIAVRDLTDLNDQLARARAIQQPVLLDFYADWCSSCVAMDQHVFNANKIQPVLNNFILLRVDLSANTSADSEILKRFNVIAPPTMLFFNNAGQEVMSRRIVGELNAKELLMRLNSFMTANCDKKVSC